jgi:hypothetical protein
MGGDAWHVWHLSASTAATSAGKAPVVGGVAHDENAAVTNDWQVTVVVASGETAAPPSSEPLAEASCEGCAEEGEELLLQASRSRGAGIRNERERM